MQISRHWRLNAQRYRLQGVRYENGEVSLQDRPQPLGVEYGVLGLDADDECETKIDTPSMGMRAVSGRH